MVKRIKNWDKLNDTHFGFDGEILAIITDKIIEEDDSSEYQFGVWNLREFVLKGRLVITQSNTINLKTSKKDYMDEYVLTIKTNHNPQQYTTQYMLNDEIMRNFDLFKHYLTASCKKMLKDIKETKEWKIQSGFTL